MTRETILYNCQRVLAFIEAEPININIPDSDITTMGLLHWHSRLLDVYGLPYFGLSLLIINNLEDFEELRFHAKLNFRDSFIDIMPIEYCREKFNNNYPDLAASGAEMFSSVKTSLFSFDYNSYKWEVKYTKRQIGNKKLE